MSKHQPTIIGIGGFASNSGKTTLLCDLLQRFPGWEAIKTTRGHYRSCGKDPHSCCVSDLLGDQPRIRSGRADTYAVGKDTGRYWEAGAANVHWVIATQEQVGSGITQALKLVNAKGVFVEGNSFSSFVAVDLMIMVARGSGSPVKGSARKALAISSAFYLTGEASLQANSSEREQFQEALTRSGLIHAASLPIYTRSELSQLAEQVRETSCTLGN